MRCVFIDYETYYDKEYTLRKMSMEAYIRDPRYETQLLGLAIDHGPIYVLTAEQIPDVLAALELHRADTYVFAHNMKFDGLITSERYGIHIKNPICTRAMMRWTGISRLVRESQASLTQFLGTGEKGTFIESMEGRRARDLDAEDLGNYNNYCAGDIRDLRANTFAMMPQMSQDALDFIAMTTAMYTTPRFVIDRPLLEEYYQSLVDAHAQSQERLQHLFRFPTQAAFLKALRSKKQFCELLTSIGGVVPYKISEKKTETAKKKLEAELASTTDPATQAQLQQALDDETYIVMDAALAKKDLAFIELQNSPDPDIAALATARAENNSSIAMSRTITFLEIARRGTLAVPLEPYQAWTGRYSGGSAIEDVQSDKVNLQNLASRGGDKTLRHSIMAPAGHCIVAGDSSQIEARLLAWAAQQTDLIEDFASGGDPYCTFGGIAYHEPGETVHYWTKGEGARLEGHAEEKRKYKQIRNIGKTGILQLGYGSGASKLALYLAQQGVLLDYTAPSETTYLDDDGKTQRVAAVGDVIGGKAGHALECKRLVDTYRSTYAMIPAFWRTCSNVIRELYMGGSGYFGGPLGDAFYYTSEHHVFGHKVPGIMLPDGYWLRYPNLREETNDEGRREWVYDQMAKGRKIKKKIYGGLLVNNLIQGISFSLMRYQALNINKVIPVVLNVHDEWVTIVPEIAEQAAVEFVTQEMRRIPSWVAGAPIDCEVSSGRTYGEI